MKLILLRHEDRENYPGFLSNITREGFNNTIKLENKLKKLKIDIIYSSPFIRTLQTIYWYCIKNNKKVNMEFSISEYRHNIYFLFENIIYDLNLIPNELNKIINDDYKSFLKNDNLSLLENNTSLKKRVNKFIQKLIKNKDLKNKNILIVSHKAVLNMIKQQFINKNVEIKDDFNRGTFEIYNIKQ
tara:strand:- start:1973 stop:2530 length:558 start_codon:yes stop_codon:yes gene_type:complete